MHALAQESQRKLAPKGKERQSTNEQGENN